VPRQGRVLDAHVAELGEGGLQRREQLRLELAVDLIAGVALGDVAADVRVEQDRVRHGVAVLAEAADGHRHLETQIPVHHLERHRRGRAVLVADDLLGVDIIDALILRSLAAEGEALADVAEDLLQVGSQLAAREEGRLGRHVVGVLARLGAEVDDLALLDDEHALARRDRDDGAVGDDVDVALCVGRPACRLFHALDRQHVGGQGLAVEVLLPLIGQHAAGRAKCRFDKTHIPFLLSV